MHPLSERCYKLFAALHSHFLKYPRKHSTRTKNYRAGQKFQRRNLTPYSAYKEKPQGPGWNADENLWSVYRRPGTDNTGQIQIPTENKSGDAV